MNTSPITSSFINLDFPLANLAQRYLQTMLAREHKRGRALVLNAVEQG